MPRDMSWLSPKRRRTAPNLKAANATVATAGIRESIDEEMEIVNPSESSLSTMQTTPAASRPPLPPASLPSSMSALPSVHEDGNLFYAYAQQADDSQSRYLLTFASVSIVNEWWQLLQTYFSDCARPCLQLFSFKTDNLLGKAWNHAEFAHLKSKWMYMQFNEASNTGGAPQGIIPVQNARGHILGGAAGSPESRKETKSMRNEVKMLEGHFERMMEAVENNTEQIAALAIGRKENDAALVQAVKETTGHSSGNLINDEHIEISELSWHLGRIGDLLARNQDYIENLSRRQYESEQKLREVLQESKTQKRAETLDMDKLSSHLDRIQRMMETQAHYRKDSGKDFGTSAPKIDLSPLTGRLESVLGAVEQNSTLMRDVLHIRQNGDQHQSLRIESDVDLSPWVTHLENTQRAIQQRSTKPAPIGKKLDELVDMHGTSKGQGSPLDLSPLQARLDTLIEVQKEAASKPSADIDLSPLEQRLDDLLDASHAVTSNQQIAATAMSLRFDKLIEGQQKAMERGPFDISLLSHRLDEILSMHRDAATIALGEKVDQLSQAQLQVAEMHNPALLLQKLDTLTAEITGMRTSVDSKLITRLASIHATSKKSADSADRLVKLQQESNDKIAPAAMDLTPLTLSISRPVDTCTPVTTVDAPPADLGPLVEHLNALRSAAKENGAHLAALVKSQSADRKALVVSSNIDITPLADRLTHIHDILERQAEAAHSDNPTGGDGNVKFIMKALSSHLSRIQAVTEANANAVHALKDSHLARESEMHAAVSATNEQLRELREAQRLSHAPVLQALTRTTEDVRTLTTHVRSLAKTVTESKASSADELRALTARSTAFEGVRDGQVNQVLRVQEEMVDVMRNLARALMEEKKECGHIILPPPRKLTGRKVVGFVYEGGEGRGAGKVRV